MSRTTTIGLALLLVGVIAGAAGANAVQSLERARFLVSGLFTLDPGEVGELQRRPSRTDAAAPGQVLLHLLDAKGAVVARRDVTLEPGQSATLALQPARFFRAQAQIVEPDMPLGSRRSSSAPSRSWPQNGTRNRSTLDFAIPTPLRLQQRRRRRQRPFA